MVKRFLDWLEELWLRFPKITEYTLQCDRCRKSGVYPADQVVWSVATGYPMSKEGKRLACKHAGCAGKVF